MLVLSRKENESFMVGDDCRITIVRCKRYSATVRIGIEAPDGTVILRSELINDVSKEQEVV